MDLTTYLADYQFNNHPLAHQQNVDHQTESARMGRRNKMRYEREKKNLNAVQDDVEP